MSIHVKVEGGESIRYERAKHRVIFAGGVYHVIQRAPGQELLFREKGDYFHFQRLLSQTSKNFGVSFICFSLLPNHVHLLLQLTEKNLSNSMKHLFESYAMHFNKKYSRKGHVFFGPFRAMVCDSDSYLLAASVYIHLNAFRAGLCETFDGYGWDSMDLFLSSCAKDKLVKPNLVLSQLNEDRSLACQEYQKILREAAKRPVAQGRTIRDISKTVNCYKRMLAGGQNGPVLRILPPKNGRKALGKAVFAIDRLLELMVKGQERESIQREMGISKATYFRLLKRANDVNLFTR